jgi:hypothetical protein
MLRSPMPRAAQAAVALLMMALLVPVAARAAAPKNLLVNPDFEEGLAAHPWMPAGWDTSVSGLPTVFFGRDTFLVHSGRFAVSVANVSAMLPMAHNWSQTLLVGSEAWGKDLVFTVWTRSIGVDGRAYCLLQAYRDTISKMSRVWGIPRDDAASRLRINRVDDPLTELGWKREVFIEPETEWTRRELRVYCPPSVNVVFVRCGVIGTGQVFLDDASLTLEKAQPAPAVKPGVNLLADPGFEEDLRAWEISMPPYGGLTVQRDTTLSHSGHACVRFEYLQNLGLPTAPVQARVGVCQGITNRNLAGKRLKYSAWVKTDSLKGVAYLKLYAHTIGGGMVQTIASEQFSLDTPWTETTQVLDLPPDTYQVWAWCVYDAPVPGRVYFDDTRLEVLGPVPPAPKPPKPDAKKKS